MEKEEGKQREVQGDVGRYVIREQNNKIIRSFYIVYSILFRKHSTQLEKGRHCRTQKRSRALGLKRALFRAHLMCLFFFFVFAVSSVLERKISMRRSRQELIDKGVLKEISENGKAVFRRHGYTRA